MTRATGLVEDETITVYIPITFMKRGGRKLVVMPEGRLAAAAGGQRYGQGAWWDRLRPPRRPKHRSLSIFRPAF